MIQETIRSRGITVDGPRTLAQGGYGMVIRQAIYKDNSFQGIVSVTVKIDNIVNQLALEDSNIYVTAEDHTFLFGNESHADELQLTVPVQAYNQHWLMGISCPPTRNGKCSAAYCGSILPSCL